MRRRIKLKLSEWNLDESSPLGKPGGFGAVFKGTGLDGTNVAIKKLNINADQAAHREMDMAEALVGKPLEHVIPTYDAGKDTTSGQYFVVMGLAEFSLQDILDTKGPFTESEAIEIATQVTQGLLSVKGTIHRDIKPANILFHDGYWKIADFGIAKFVEDSTSLNTLRDCLSPPFAAPEQWRGEKSSQKTDVYALGCVLYALLTGTPPFNGPSIADFRTQHLSHPPSELTGIRPDLASLITWMLRKSEGSRPEVYRVLSGLENLVKPKTNAQVESAMALAVKQLAETQAREEANQAQVLLLTEQRERVAEVGLEIFHKMFEEFYRRLLEEAPMAEKSFALGSPVKQIRLGDAVLDAKLLLGGKAIEPKAFGNSGWDVILGAILNLYQAQPRYIWGANLWYAKLGEHPDEYRWWDVAYMATLGGNQPYQPFALEKIIHADIAASKIMGKHQFAYRPKIIDDEDFDSFYARWRDLLAQASLGNLTHPRYLPLD